MFNVYVRGRHSNLRSVPHSHARPTYWDSYSIYLHVDDAADEVMMISTCKMEIIMLMVQPINQSILLLQV